MCLLFQVSFSFFTNLCQTKMHMRKIYLTDTLIKQKNVQQLCRKVTLINVKNHYRKGIYVRHT